MSGILSAIQAAALDAIPGVRHGFFTRIGGVSTGVYRGLNAGLNSGDDPVAIAENRRRIASHLGLEATRLVSVNQVHGATVAPLDRPFPVDARPDADAMVTSVPGLALGVAAADCAPILLADPAASVIGAAHAGWRGALEGVLPATLAAMQRLGADPARVVAVIGPTISQDRYEVGADLRDRFLAADPAFDAFFGPGIRAGHVQFDLPGFVAAQLEALGLGNVVDLRLCTYDDEDRFYSFRRSTHRKEADYGRQLSAIVLA